jgi:hypothetical protein
LTNIYTETNKWSSLFTTTGLIPVKGLNNNSEKTKRVIDAKKLRTCTEVPLTCLPAGREVSEIHRVST